MIFSKKFMLLNVLCVCAHNVYVSEGGLDSFGTHRESQDESTGSRHAYLGDSSGSAPLSAADVRVASVSMPAVVDAGLADTSVELVYASSFGRCTNSNCASTDDQESQEEAAGTVAGSAARGNRRRADQFIGNNRRAIPAQAVSSTLVPAHSIVRVLREYTFPDDSSVAAAAVAATATAAVATVQAQTQYQRSVANGADSDSEVFECAGRNRTRSSAHAVGDADDVLLPFAFVEVEQGTPSAPGGMDVALTSNEAVASLFSPTLAVQCSSRVVGRQPEVAAAAAAQSVSSSASTSESATSSVNTDHRTVDPRRVVSGEELDLLEDAGNVSQKRKIQIPAWMRSNLFAAAGTRQTMGAEHVQADSEADDERSVTTSDDQAVQPDSIHGFAGSPARRLSLADTDTRFFVVPCTDPEEMLKVSFPGSTSCGLSLSQLHAAAAAAMAASATAGRDGCRPLLSTDVCLVPPRKGSK